MKPWSTRAKLAIALAAVSTAVALPAGAVLQRQGPVDGSNGFPAWYQDRNGIALELCTINHPDPTIDRKSTRLNSSH